MARRSGWTCQRQAAGVKCGTRNPSRTRKCSVCGKARPVRRRPAHMAALDLTYADYVAINGGEHCGICGKTRDQLPNPDRKLDRDHEHRGSGRARGVLCRECNRKLTQKIADPRWLRQATYYLERTA